MKFSNVITTALAVLAAPSMVAAQAEEPSSSVSLYDLFSSVFVTSNTIDMEAVPTMTTSASTTRKHSGKKGKKNIGKLIETYTTVIIATQDDNNPNVSESAIDSEAISYMGDNLLFSYNAVQTNSDLTGFGSHFGGEQEGPDDAEAAVLFPELALLEDDTTSTLRGSAERRSSYRYSNYVFFYSFGCRLCGDDDSLVGDGDFLENWEEAFCDQLLGSGLAAFDGAKGCRILQTDSAAAAAKNVLA